jgi:hypothetical protein
VGLSQGELELERLYAFLWRSFPEERINLQPVAAHKATATVNLVMKLLLGDMPVQGFPITYTISGTKRHLRSEKLNDKGEPVTFCGYPAYTIRELLERGSIASDNVSTWRRADLCGSCRKAFLALHPVTDQEMAAARRSLAALEESLGD